MHGSRWQNTHRTLKSLDYIAHLALKRQNHAWDKWRTSDSKSQGQEPEKPDEYELMAMRAERCRRSVGVSAVEGAASSTVEGHVESGSPIGSGDTLAGGSVPPSQDAHPPLRNSSHMHAPKSPQRPTVVVRRKHYLPTGVAAPPTDPALIGDPTPPYMPAAPPEIDDSLDTPEKSLRTLKWAETEARKLMKMEQEKPRPSASAMVAYIDKVIKSQEAQVKVRGEIKRRKDEMPQEWTEVRDKIITALQPYPQALKAVIEALTRK